MNERENLWSELLQRKVVRSLALYLTGAWLVIQVASLLADIWSLSGGVVQNLFLLLLLGLPFVAVLSWIYDIRETQHREAGFADLLRRELHARPGRAALAAAGITVLFLLGVAYAWPDEELSADARTLARFAPRVAEDPHNFNYGVFGLHAPEGAGIWDHGRLVASQRMVLGEDFPAGLGSGFTIDEESLCELREKGCAERLLEEVAGAPRLLEANALPVARYRELRGATSFGYPVEISRIDEPLPTYSNIALLGRLEVLAALHLEASGEYAQALAHLEEDLDFHRRMLARINLMIGKMAAVRSIQNHVRALAMLTERAAHRPGRAGFPGHPPARLGAAERSVIEVMGAETQWMTRMLHSDESRGRIAALLFEEKPLQRVAFQVLPLRRNALLNRLSAEIMQTARDGQLGARELAALPPAEPRRPRWLEYFNDGAGMLLEDYAPLYRMYLERFHDLDALIVLAQVAHQLHAEQVPADAIPGALLALPASLRDPFTGAAPVWEHGELRFTRSDGEERRVAPWLPFRPVVTSAVEPAAPPEATGG